VIGTDVGLHLAAELTAPVAASDLVEKVAADGIRLQPLDRYAAEKPPANGLVLGYGMIPVDRIDEGIYRLARTINSIG